MAASKETAASQMLVLTLSGIIALLGAIFIIVRGSVNSIVNPINGIKQTMRNLTDGHLSAEVQGLDQGGEIGEMSAAVQIFKDSMIHSEELTREQEAQRLEKDAHSARLAKHVSIFDKTIVSVLDGLTQVSGTMQSTSEGVSLGAEETRALALNVASAAEETSVNVQTVASAAEELAASITEIGTQVQTASDITQKAVSVTDDTGAQIKALDESVTKIGDVVNLINDIAAQTNLLALNATIEAARAGDAGKGFAVVASEVKALATQTAQATEEIGGQIAEVQAATTAAVEAIGSITTIVTEVAEISAELSSAIDSQQIATAEIARNGEEAAAATASVAEAITRVQAAAEDSQVSATHIAEVSDDLTNQSNALKDYVNGFLNNVQENEDSVEGIASLQDKARFDDAALNLDHENIASHINALHKSYRSGADAKEMAATFGELKDEIISHFAREEEYMDQIDYPNLAEHTQVHQGFLTRVIELYEAYEAQEEGAGHALTAFLGLWFNDHVNHQDRSIIGYARQKDSESKAA
jgi:methyl-accepting chemotaxis protein